MASIRRRYIVWTLTFLMLIGLIGFPSISLTEEGKWTKKADMRTARRNLSTSVVDGKIYAIGGWDDNRFLSTVEEYNPATNKWIKKADMPIARVELHTSAVNGKVYAIDGRAVEECNPITGIWTKKADMPAERWAFPLAQYMGRFMSLVVLYVSRFFRQ